MKPHLLAVLVAAGGAASCHAPSSPPTSDLVVQVDAGSPSHDFDGPGTLFLTDGWGRPGGDGSGSDWDGMAWTVGREAVVHVPTVPGGPTDLFARVLPFPWSPGAPVQEIMVEVGGRVSARATLARRWQDLRLPLPDDFSSGRLEEIRLRFAHALSPRDLGTGPDERPLAVAFTQLAVVPRRVRDPRAFLAAAGFDVSTGRAQVPAGGAASVMLPAAARVRVRLAGAHTSCENCSVAVDLVGPSGSRRLWEGPAFLSPEVDETFRTGPGGPSRLVLAVDTSVPDEIGQTVSFALGAGAVSAHRSRPRGGAPNVFIYLVDTLRADVLAAEGADPATAPRINSFAKEATTYVRARATSTWTLPSVASLLSGQYADRHGMMRGDTVIDPETSPLLLPGRLAALGYRTLGISHSTVVGRLYGFDAGFQEFFESPYLNATQLRSQEAGLLLGAWLANWDGKAPVFAYLHTVDPHAPYAPPTASRILGEDGLPLDEYRPRTFADGHHETDRHRIAQMQALYRAEVQEADARFGAFVDLLKWLGLFDDSMVILVGDHGEEFHEHGGFDHGRTLFGETLRVPLVIRYPEGRWAGRQVAAPVSLVDIVPTVLAAVGSLPGGPESDGAPLAPAPDTGARSGLFFEVAPAPAPGVGGGEVDLVGAAVGGLKCIENRGLTDRFGRPAAPLAAYDLSADPLEARPHVTGALVDECLAILDRWAEARQGLKRSRRDTPAPPEAMEQLRALGYAE